VKLVCQGLRDKIAEVYHLAQVPSVVEAPVRDVTVILGSSRSGSSLLFHLLSESGAFFAPQGEETPFYRLAGVGWTGVRNGSDAIRVPIADDVRQQALHALMRDVGGEPVSDLRSLEFQAQVATRLLLQWAHLDLRPEVVLRAVREAAERSEDYLTLWMNLLIHLGLESGFYDLPGPKSRNLQFESPDFFFEEPPFVLQTPRAAFDGSKPLLLKTSSNAYRVNWLRTLFPGASFKWIVLGRNPASVINGLMDGWLSNAFHSHNMQFVTPLKIRGYTDVIPFGDRWWKFDLPPGWSDFDDAPLVDVCAFQWRMAYSSILQLNDVLNVRFEELLQPKSDVLAQIFEFAGTQPRRTVNIGSARPVMASVPPAQARWRAREEEIWPRVQEPRIKEIAQRLGYDLSSPERLP
jgi:hypothetical protein